MYYNVNRILLVECCQRKPFAMSVMSLKECVEYTLQYKCTPISFNFRMKEIRQKDGHPNSKLCMERNTSEMKANNETIIFITSSGESEIRI